MISVFAYLLALLATLVVVLVLLFRQIAKEKALHAADSARRLPERRERDVDPRA